MAARLRRIGDALAALAGARPDVLESAPGARHRFVALGGVLLSTGGLAVVSAAFAVHMALGAWWPVALLVGLGWGTVIVNLDRMLVVGMAHDSSLKRNLVLAVPRLGLAVVLGLVIATPLTLQVFHREIDTEIVSLQAEQSDAYRASLDHDARFSGLPALKQRVATEQGIVASGGQSDTGLAAVHADVTTKQAAYDQELASYQDLDAKAQCELNGTCGTGRAGDGTAYQQAKAAADAQAAVVASAKASLDSALASASAAEARSARQAQGDLAADQATVTRLSAEQDRLQAAFDATNKDDDGILMRLTALSRLSDRSATLATAHRLLALLFMSIELLPVLMKLLLNFSPPTAYDRLAALRDSGDVAVEELQQEARRTVEAANAELLIMAEQERIERQKESILTRQRAAAERRTAEEARREAEQRRRELEERRVAEERLRAAQEAARAALEQSDEDVHEENVRRPWDTGPILTVARNAAARTVRSITRRATDRIPA